MAAAMINLRSRSYSAFLPVHKIVAKAKNFGWSMYEGDSQMKWGFCVVTPCFSGPRQFSLLFSLRRTPF